MILTYSPIYAVITSPADNDILEFDAASGRWQNVPASAAGAVLGTGTPGTIPLWTAVSTIGDSQITDDGIVVTIAGHLIVKGITGGTQLARSTALTTGSRTGLNVAQITTGVAASGLAIKSDWVYVSALDPYQVMGFIQGVRGALKTDTKFLFVTGNTTKNEFFLEVNSTNKTSILNSASSSINTGIDGVVIVGGSSITGKTADTVYVPQLGFFESGAIEGILNNATLTADRAWTLPDISGEVIVTAGTQTMSGDKTFTGAVAMTNLTLSGNMLIEGAGELRFKDTSNFIQNPSTGLDYYASVGHQFFMGGAAKVLMVSTGAVFNSLQTGFDFLVKGDVDADLFWVDVSTDRVGISTSAPLEILSIDSGNISLGNVAAGTNADKVMVFANGTAPTTSPVDIAQIYAADHAGAGTSTIHVRNEEGDIFKFIKSAAYTPTNVSTDRAYDANSTTLNELADVVGTLITDLQSTGLIG